MSQVEHTILLLSDLHLEVAPVEPVRPAPTPVVAECRNGSEAKPLEFVGNPKVDFPGLFYWQAKEHKSDIQRYIQSIY